MTEDHAGRESELLEEQGWLFKPAESFISDPDRSPPIPFGLPDLDEAYAGGLRQGLHIVGGFAHNGKTQLLLRLFWENRDKAMVLFTPDEDTESVIFKLVCLATGKKLEEVIFLPAQEKKAVMREFFPRLAIDDHRRSTYEMVQIIEEAQQYWGQEVRLAAYDYLGYMASARGDDMGGSIIKAANKAKDMVHQTGIPWVVLHQANRSAAKGTSLGPASLSYGGEQQATTVTMVRRQAFDPNLSTGGLRQEAHCPTIHIGITKNKQTYKYLERQGPGHEVMHAIDKATGLIRPMGPADKVMTSLSQVGRVDHG